MNEIKPISPKSLSNEALLQNTQALVAEERKLTTAILWHLYEIQKRRLYSEKGYSSLFEYVVQALGYSEAAAGRRISAMRLLVEVPEIEPALQGKSRRECEKELAAMDPQAAAPQERERVVSPTQTEIRFVADDALMEKLKQIRELDGHVLFETSYLELFHRMADIALKKLDPLATKSTPPAEPPKDAAVQKMQSSKDPRFVPAELRRAVWARDRSRCSYVSSDGRRCESRFALEIDHKTPIAHGGQSALSNLQLLCRNHNRHKAVVQLGEHRMRPYFR